MKKTLFLIVACACSIIGCTRWHDVSLPADLSTARSYRWIDVPKSDSLLLQIDTCLLNETQRLYWRVSRISTQYGLTQYVSQETETEINSLVDACAHRNLDDLCGELYYIKGSMHLLENKDSSVVWLKKAEEHLLRTANPKPLLSVIYLRLATLSEIEYLFHLTYHYDELANQYCTPGTPHLKYSCYRGMANRCSYVFDDYDSIQTILYDSAMYYARLINNPLITSDLRLRMALEKDEPDSIFLAAQFKCDSCGQARDACFVAQHYMNTHQLKEAERYMQIFAGSFGETGFDFSDWDTRKYHYLKSRYLYETGHPKEAFEMMRALNDSVDEMADRTARVRTYAISRAYDVEKEKAANLRLINQRQHLYLFISEL